MRVRAFALFAVLLLPAPLSAQIRIRLPRIGRPPAPAPLPPQAPSIAREMRYKRSRFSAESYTLFSFNQTDRYVADRGVANTSMLGAGTRIDWRYRPAFSITGDLTSSLFGGPYIQNAFDFGGRYHPIRDYDYKIHPYVDLRASWAWSYASFATPFDPISSIATPTIQGGRTTSHGMGGLVGAGFETSLTRSLALTTGLGLSRYRMHSVQVGQQRLGSDWNYRTTTVRVMLGLTYNPGRMVPIQ